MSATLVAFICTAIAIHDADGPIWCEEGPKVRLSGIAARELDGTCRPGHPCPTTDPIMARATIVQLLGAKVDEDRSDEEHIFFLRPVRLRCESTGTSYSRVTAWCALPDGRDLSCAAIEAGAALRWSRYDAGGRLIGCGSEQATGWKSWLSHAWEWLRSWWS